MAFAAFATRRRSPPNRRRRRKSSIALFLLLPGRRSTSALFFLAPLVSLILTVASRRRREFGDIGQYDYAFNWENYVDGRAARTGRTSSARSATRSLATVFALLFSYPLAYFIGVKLRR